MEKVYLVMFTYDYEGSDVDSVHRTQESAILKAESYEKNGYQRTKGHLHWRGCGVDLTVEEFEVK